MTKMPGEPVPAPGGPAGIEENISVNRMLQDQEDEEYCLCLGSLYLVGEIRQMLEEIEEI